MHILALTVLCLALAGITVAASDTMASIHFYSDDTGCVNHWFGCSNLPFGYCCATSNPYCRWVQCVGCHAQNMTTYELAAHTNDDCSGSPSFSCTATAAESCCKVYKPAGSDPDICSAMVKMVPEGSDNLKLEEGDMKCLGSREPDVFGLTYENRTAWNIHLPRGLYQSALAFAARRDFDGLVAHFELSRER